MKNLVVFALGLSFLVGFKAQASAPAYADNVGFGMDGLWYDATVDQYGQSTNGQGFDVKYIKRTNGAQEVVLYWYTYDSSGTRHVWLIGQGNLIGNAAQLNLMRVTGGKFNTKTPPVTLTTVGTMTFTLVDCNNANVSWAFNQSFEGISGAGYLNLSRISPLLSVNGYDLCSTPLSFFDSSGGDAEYNQLLSQYNTLLSNYNSLNSDYNYLYSEYNSLLSDYNSIYSDYSSLLSDYNYLYSDYNDLYSDYQSLSWDYDDLLADYNDLYNECYGGGWAQSKAAKKARVAAKASKAKIAKKTYSVKTKRAAIVFRKPAK